VSKIPDDWFDRYKFCQPLGQGGMGIIYLAEDKQNGQAPCVVKQLISTNTDSEERDEAIRLFMREVHMLSHLEHRGIVRFFDHHVTKDGKYFLVMDFIPGKNLEAIVAQYGPFTSEATVEIGIQCCEVLEYLHEQNPAIIYRDLKPSNLMLTPEGEIVFIDFGIARTFMPKQSATRVVTAGYSPPEQYFGRPETRSDLYALGATLGHLLTGQRPKPLSSSAPRMLKHDVLFTLDDLIRRMTSHNPEDRPVTARQVRYELYHIYQEIHPDFEVPQEALLALEKLSIANKYLSSPTFKEKAEAQQQKSSQQKMPEVDPNKDYDTRDLMRLTRDKNSTMQRRLTSTKKRGIWDKIKELLNIR
jgi:serine/threonine protein kinase